MVNIEIIQNDIISALKSINAEKIILFGSYAYGNPTENSDLDICVVEKKYESKWKEKKKIRKLLEHIKMPKDILVSYSEEYNFYKNEINSVFNDVDKKGVILWPKDS